MVEGETQVYTVTIGSFLRQKTLSVAKKFIVTTAGLVKNLTVERRIS